MKRALFVLASLTLLASCEREERRFSESPPTVTPSQGVVVSALQPGPYFLDTRYEGPYDDKAWAASEGKRLFAQMNCSGCHANGGGGMGPPLMDDEWIYGSNPEQIFSTIAEGRPNGMPAWKYTLSNQQIWELVSYIRSLSGLTPKGARGARDDHMYVKPAEAQTQNAVPKQSGVPMPTESP